MNRDYRITMTTGNIYFVDKKTRDEIRKQQRECCNESEAFYDLGENTINVTSISEIVKQVVINTNFKVNVGECIA